MTTAAGTALDSEIAKARTRLLPFLILMYVLAFIDRANVGFAKNVLQADTGLSDAAFAFGAGIFFVGYAIFEVPMITRYILRIPEPYQTKNHGRTSLSQKRRIPMEDPSVLYLCVAAGCVALFCAVLTVATLADRRRRETSHLSGGSRDRSDAP